MTGSQPNNGRSKNGPYDVAILGTGQAGSLLGTILAAHGARVLLLDRDEHPRFAVGESTIPQTSMMIRILAARYRVPEIEHCGTLENLHKHVCSSCGIKRNFGFVYHRPGERQQPHEVNQTIIPEFAHGPESHLFRQDVDAYALLQALHRGAELKQRRNITEISFDGSGVTLADSRGEEFRARYLVDASGFRSPLAQKLELRPDPNPLKTHSRTIFTHMIDVDPYEDCVEPQGAHQVPLRWSQGTLHHIFDGGWLWVIPFNNHERSTNPLCSVGLTVDPRRFPRDGLTPEKEFEEFLSRFPDVARQFQSARAAREWVATGRLQYTSTRSVGDRFCLMSHSAGFIDALFSRGLSNTTEVVNALAGRLLAALADDDLSAERFDYVDRLQRNLISYNDRLVNGSFIAFSDYDLWNAWHRLWIVGTFLGWLRLNRMHQIFLDSGDPAVYDRMETTSYPGSICPGLTGFEELFTATTAEIEAVEHGQPAAQAASRIMELVRDADFIPPVLALGDNSRRHTPVFDHSALLDLFHWLKRSAPAELRSWYTA